MEYVTLSNGVKMPILGYGVYQVTKDECERCVLDALKVGYRAIDTAQSYFNEEEVGNAIEKSGVPREEIFLTTKVWIEHYGYEEAKKSVLESMKKLKTDYLDLVLLHQPFSDAYGAYRALEDLYDEGKIRAIGISNFYVDRMVDFASFNRIKPMINQVETHIFNQQKELKEWADKYGIQLEAWAPFGEGRGGTFDWDSTISPIKFWYWLKDAFRKFMLSRRRSTPSFRFCVETSVSLSNREIWILPPPMSTMAVPFSIISSNCCPCKAMDL